MMYIVNVIMRSDNVFKQYIRGEQVDEEMASVSVGGESEYFIGVDVSGVADGMDACEGGVERG